MRQSAERTRHTSAVNSHARFVEDHLDHLSKTDGTVEDVVKVFAMVPASYRCDVFWKLDNDHNTKGHGLLRRTRNTPSAGKKLFALFK